MPVCPKSNFLLGHKCFSIAEVHMSLDTVWGTVASAVLLADVFLVSILQSGDWTTVSSSDKSYCSVFITTTDQHQDLAWPYILVLSVSTILMIMAKH